MGYAAYLYCVLHLSSPRVAITTYINNLVALVIGWLMLGELLSGSMLIGGAVLLVGVWIVRANTMAVRTRQQIKSEPAAVSVSLKA
jgi:drug/metabolite transporter (DMT)-like permease